VTRDWGLEALAVRVGIESGLVVVGPVGAGERIEYGAVGDAVNTASPLCFSGST
jgi:class 3 adenylate cyclase